MISRWIRIKVRAWLAQDDVAPSPALPSAIGRCKYDELASLPIDGTMEWPSLTIRNRRAARYAADQMQLRFRMRFAVLSKCLRRMA